MGVNVWFFSRVLIYLGVNNFIECLLYVFIFILNVNFVRVEIVVCFVYFCVYRVW